MWYKISTMYVGDHQQVRPLKTPTVIETDFTTATIASLTAQWWWSVTSISNVGYTLNSSWFCVNHSGNDKFATITFSMSGNWITNPASVSLYEEWTGISWSWAWWNQLVINDNWTVSPVEYINARVNFNNNSWAKAQWIYYWNSTVAVSQAWLATGTYSMQLDYDYTTWVCNYELKNNWTTLVTQTYTFNATEMATIAWLDYLGVTSWYWMWNGWNYITYAKFIITY